MAEGNLYRLRDESLMAGLEAWDIPRVVSLEPLTGGYSADVWRLDLADGSSLVAKFAYDSRGAFETQLRTTEFLCDRGLPVARPTRSKSGELCVMVEGPADKFHPLGLMTFMPGRLVERFDDEVQREAAGLLARIHGAMLEADFVSRDPRWFYSYLEDETEPIAHEDWVRPAVRDVLAAVRAFEAEHEVTRGIIMAADIELILDPKTGSLGAVDLGHSIWGPLVADVAFMQLEMRGRGFSPAPFVEAYFRRLTVREEERLALPIYARMRLAGHIRFFAWRVLHASQYEPAAREANERRLWGLRRKLENYEEPARQQTPR